MSLHWDHHFCLTCDTQTDGTPYCSEHCRLADFETSTTPSSPNSVSSPTRACFPSSPVALSQQHIPQEHLQLQQPQQRKSRPLRSPVALLSGPQPSTQSMAPCVPLSQRALWNPFEERSYYAPPPAATRPHILSPSSSRTSLSSIRSTASSGSGTAIVSEKAARELREYARSFESARSQRRRSQ